MIRFKDIEFRLLLRKLEIVKIRGYYQLKVENTSGMDFKNVFWHKFNTYAEVERFLEQNPLFNSQTIIDKNSAKTAP